MSLTRSIVSNRHAVWAIAAAAAVFGAMAYVQLPMQLFPDTAPPLVNVLTIYPGASAEDVSQDLGRLLDEEFASVEGVYRVKSTSQDNMSLISVEFVYTRDVDQAALDIQNAISRIRSKLPSSIKEPQVLKFSTSDRPIITVGISAPDLKEARRLAEDVIAPRFQRALGVAAIDVFGGSVRAMTVDVDLEKAKAYRVPLGRIVQIIKSHNITLPAGRLRTERSQTNFRMEARTADAAELARLPVSLPGGGRLLLSDLATIETGTMDDDSYFFIDGERYIALQGYKSEEANTVRVVGRIAAIVDELKVEYPDFKFQIGEESATFAETSISNLLGNIGQALLLASLVIFFFIGKTRLALVAVISMPLSYGITFALMKQTGTEFNMVTLTAVILAVGMVVDASVVVLENISRLKETGLDMVEAVVQGTDEIRLPVIAGAATTIAVLIPLLFTQGFTGKTFGPLALTLLYAFSSSVVVALVLVPVLALYTGGESKIDDIGEKIAAPFMVLMDWLRKGYMVALRGAMRFRILTIIMAFLMLGASMKLLGSMGMETLPPMDGGAFYISLETPSGSSLQETERAVKMVEELLKKEPEVKKIQSQIGFEEGMRSFSGTGAQGPTLGFISATLSDRTDREDSIWDIENRVRKEVLKVPGIRVFTVREMGNTAKATTVAPIAIRISGPDRLVLDHIGDEVKAKILPIDSVVEPVRSWRIDQKQMTVSVDRLRAEEIHITPAQVAMQMQMGSVGVNAGDFYARNGNSIPVWVRFPPLSDRGPEQLLDFPISVPGSMDTVPLRSVASIKETIGSALVTRENQINTLDITAFTSGRPVNFIINDVEKAIDSINIPAGYSMVITGEKADMAESKKEIAGALIMALIAVYLLLVAQLRSFMHPITIMVSIPLSLIGVSIALYIVGKPASMPVMVGMILLVGTVVNNSIILIDFIRKARESGVETATAISDAVHTRFRPIMMTSFSTVVGMIPLAAEWALGAERFAPLAVAVIGGMSVATLLTLIIIPVFYSLSESAKNGIAGLFGKKSAGAATVAILLGVSTLLAPSSASAATVELELQQALQMATEHSELLKARDADIAYAGAKRKEVRGKFLPSVNIDSRYSKVSEVEPGKIVMPSPDPSMPPQTVALGEMLTDLYSFRISATQPLFTGFSAINAYRAAAQGEEIMGWRKEIDVQDLRLRVETTYFMVYQARVFEKVTEQSYSFLENHLAQVNILADAGRATELDIAKVKARKAEIQTNLLKARSGVLSTQLALNSLLGLAPDTELKLLTEPQIPGLATAKNTSELQEKALQQRPELQLSEKRAEQAEFMAKAAGGDLWPKIMLHGGYTIANPNTRYFPIKDEFNDTWDVSLILSWKVWDWGSTWFKLEGAQQEQARAEHEAAQLSSFVSLEVAQLREGMPNFIERIAAAEEGVQAAQTAHTVATVLFNAERVNSTEVLDADLALVRAKAALVEAQVDAHLAAIKLQRAVGAE